MDVASIGGMGGVDIAALSMAAKAEETAQDYGVAVLKNALDTQDALASTILSQLMEMPGKIDTRI